MMIPLDVGDRVAWTERDRGIVVASEETRTSTGRRLTVAVWRDGRFTGHVTRLPPALLYRTARLGEAAHAPPGAASPFTRPLDAHP